MRTRRFLDTLVGAFALAPLLLQTAIAQEKISRSVEDDLARSGMARVIVVMKAPSIEGMMSMAFSSPASYLTETLGNGASQVRRVADLPIAVVELDTSAVARLRNDPNVFFVVPDEPLALPVPILEEAEVEDAAIAQDAGLGTTSAANHSAIAILDTGVDVSHPAFSGKVLAEACFSTAQSAAFRVTSTCPGGQDTSTVVGSGEPCDLAIRGCDHGTHVAGIAAGRPLRAASGVTVTGAAPDAGIVAIKVFTIFDEPSICGVSRPCIRSFTSDQIRALRHVKTLSASIDIGAANMSLGGGRHETSCDAFSAIAPIIAELADIGVPTVIASGNDAFFNAVGHPGCVSRAVTVTATEPDGELATEFANRSGEVDFAAPGRRIRAALPGSRVGLKTGTSMATPAVAGTLASGKMLGDGLTLPSLLMAMHKTGAFVDDPVTGNDYVRMDPTEFIGEIKAMAENSEMAAVAEEATSLADIIGKAERIVVVDPRGQLPSPAESAAMLDELGERGVQASGDGHVQVLENLGGFDAQLLARFKGAVGPNDIVISPDYLGTIQ